MNLPEKLNELYGKPHLSYSSLKNALGDIKQFDRYMKGELKYESDALAFGTLYDMLLFERDKAYDQYIIIGHEQILDHLSDKARNSKNPKLTSEYKAQLQLMNTEAIEKGKTICSSEDWKTANEMIDRLDSCGLIQSHLSGKFQVEFNEMLHGVQVKGFLDCLGSDFISDSKSSRSVDKFRYSVRDFCYDIQAYIYTQVFDIKKFYWVVQEKTYPYLPALVKCTDSTLFTGEMKFHEAVERIKTFVDAGVDPMTDYLEYEV